RGAMGGRPAGCGASSGRARRSLVASSRIQTPAGIASTAGLRPRRLDAGASMFPMRSVAGTTVSVRDVQRALGRSRSRELDIPGFRRAAVLVPLIEDAGELHLLLTVRAATLRSH